MAEDECDIFVSYSHEDAERVQLLAAALGSEGWRVFWDQEIPAGEDWESFIGVHLDSARVVIPVWSAASVRSRFVRDEVKRAEKRGVLVPVLIDSVEPMFGFGYLHASNLVAWIAEGGRGKLPDHLGNSIRRKLSLTRTVAPTTDELGNGGPQGARSEAEEIADERPAVREEGGVEAAGSACDRVADGQQLTPSSSVYRQLITKGAAGLAVFAIIGLLFVSLRGPSGLSEAAETPPTRTVVATLPTSAGTAAPPASAGATTPPTNAGAAAPPTSTAAATPPTSNAQTPRPAAVQPPSIDPPPASRERFAVSACGSISDASTKLDWYVGPERDITWQEAAAWVAGLQSCGGGWTLPSEQQVSGLIEKTKTAGTGYVTAGRSFPAHIDPVFSKIGTGSWIWLRGGSSQGTSPAYNLNQGVAVRFASNGSQFPARVFAVRELRNR